MKCECCTDAPLSSVWRTHSFFIEAKPRGDLASLFIDCVANEDVPNSESAKEFVKIGTSSLEIHDVLDNADSKPPMSRGRFAARIANMRMSPDSTCAVSWADARRRVFMCKLRINAENGGVFPRKSLRSFEEELHSQSSIAECVNNLLDAFDRLKVACRNCRSVLHTHSKIDMDFEVLPDDDWLETSPGMEYFCGQTCGHTFHESHYHQRHNSNPFYQGLLGVSSTSSPTTHQDPTQRWLPDATKVVFSNSFIMLLANETTNDVVEHDDKHRLLKCRSCAAQVGISLRSNNKVYKLHVGAVEISGGGGEEKLELVDSDEYGAVSDYISSRFTSFERYFAWMCLYKSESQSSMKLLIRTYDRRPFILIWLLEPYIIMASGVLHELSPLDDAESAASDDCDCDENAPPSLNASDQLEEAHAFPALKLLYKIYDEQSASSDPRANGGDSSVGIVDIPHGCCLKLAEILLRSSHSLPPTIRAVGQFFVGYLCLDKSME